MVFTEDHLKIFFLSSLLPRSLFQSPIVKIVTEQLGRKNEQQFKVFSEPHKVFGTSHFILFSAWIFLVLPF